MDRSYGRIWEECTGDELQLLVNFYCVDLIKKNLTNQNHLSSMANQGSEGMNDIWNDMMKNKAGLDPRYLEEYKNKGKI